MLDGRTCWLGIGQSLVTFPKTPGLFGASVNRILGTESGIGLATDDVWDTLVGLLDRFGRAAEDYASRFAIGIAPNEVRRRIEPILGDVRRIQRAGWDALPGGNALRACLERLRELAPNTYRKTMARIAGVSVIHAHFRSRMTEEDIGRAIAASSLYEMMQDLLDDLLDGGGWTFPEATRLYDRCLRPLTDSGVSTEGLEAQLADLMGPGQDGLEHVLAEATRELRGLLGAGDERVRRLLVKGHEALTRAQAATIYFQRETLDIAAIRDIATGLPSPDPSLPWLDRLAIYASWPSNIALIDASFASPPVSQKELTAHARAWLAFDEAVSFLEHFAGTEADVREGVVNFACLYANLSATMLEENSFGGFTSPQRQSIFEKATGCLVRAVREGVAGGGPAEDYVLLAVMVPTIIFAMCKTPPDQAASFFAILAPALRATMGTGHVMSEGCHPRASGTTT